MNNNLDEKLLFAKSLEDQGQFLHAIQIYTQILKISQNRKVILRLAHLYEQMKHYQQVIELIQNYLDKNDDDEIKVIFAQFLLRIEENEKLVNYFSGQINSSILAYFVGVANYKVEEFQKAKKAFLKSLSYQITDDLKSKVLFHLVEISIYFNSLGDSIDYLNELEKYSNDRKKIYYYFTKVYFLRKQFFYAKDYFFKAEKSGCTKNELYFYAGKILLELEEYEQAELYLEKFLEAKSDDAEILTLLSFTNFQLLKKDKAKAYFQKAMEIDPYNKSLINFKNQLINY